MKPESPWRQLPGLGGWLTASFIAAGIGAIASADAGGFYAELIRPRWAPPAWLFGPVWSVLYFLMGMAAWLVWRRHGLRSARSALTIFVVQLCANAAWTWIFFAWRQGAIALIEIVLLWLLIAATMVAFWRLHRLAALLLAPYLAWVSFAGALTYSLWRSNPALLG
jgi:tryptophan-rich sensory protein